jgi:hypothetical protein
MAERPAKGTPEYELWLAAIEVAIHAPLDRGVSTGSAQIYWPKIDRLRDALDAVGIDWRAAKQRRG